MEGLGQGPVVGSEVKGGVRSMPRCMKWSEGSGESPGVGSEGMRGVRRIPRTRPRAPGAKQYVSHRNTKAESMGREGLSLGHVVAIRWKDEVDGRSLRNTIM